jgi:hypothetical protein
MVLREAIKEQIYLKNLFSQISILKNQYLNQLYINNQSTIELAKNFIYYNRFEHINI